MLRTAGLLLLFALCFDLQGQLSLTEVDEDNRRHSISKPLAIVDINSTIEVAIDRDELKKRIAGDSPNLTKLIDSASSLNSAAKQGREALAKLRPLAERYDPQRATIREVNALSEALAGLAQSAGAIDATLAADPRLGAEFEALIANLAGQDDLTIYTAVLELAERLAQDLTRSLMAELPNGTFVRAGAFVVRGGVSTPVHLPGFDTIAPIDPVRIERWVVPSASDWSKLNDLENAIKERKIEDLDGYLRQTWQNLRHKVDKAASNVLSLSELKEAATIIAEIVQLADSSSHALKADVTALSNLIKQFEAEIIAIQSAAKSGSWSDARLRYMTVIEIIGQFGASLQGLLGQSDEALSVLKEKAAQLQALNLPTKVIDKAKNELVSLLSEIGLQPVLDRIDTELLQFADAVKKHSIDSIPTSASLSLLTAGNRSPGDSVVIKMTYGSDDKPESMLQSYQLAMYQVLPHTKSVILPIFAQTQTGANNLTRFRIAPSYSWLYKPEGSRASVQANRFFRFGVGLNVAMLPAGSDNLNTVGVGLVVSGLDDIVQLGYGFNTGQNKGYFFVGLRLPLAPF
ncbi:MAG: hypothetical protein HUU60_05285 [Armatimonadetes bacterium]|nr:hypothetical protein [Armatimonadota bacterium]